MTGRYRSRSGAAGSPAGGHGSARVSPAGASLVVGTDLWTRCQALNSHAWVLGSPSFPPSAPSALSRMRGRVLSLCVHAAGHTLTCVKVWVQQVVHEQLVQSVFETDVLPVQGGLGRPCRGDTVAWRDHARHLPAPERERWGQSRTSGSCVSVAMCLLCAAHRAMSGSCSGYVEDL